MESDYNYFETLIGKKLSNQLSESEQTEFEKWINLDPKNQKLFDASQKAWVNSRQPFSSEEIQKDKIKVENKIKLQLPDKNGKSRTLLFYRISAAIAIPILLALGWFAKTSFTNKQNNNTFCEISAPKGQIAECVLADGTKVWLNSESTIKYNPSFTGKIRNVKLTGEAYFEVTKMQHKPFVVQTDKVQIKVFGTSFNVKAYPDDNNTETTLEEGKIQLSVNNAPGQAPIDLSPGDHAVYESSTHKMQISKTDTYLHTAWRDGKYIFRDADLNTIIQQLEKTYGVHIHLKNEEMGRLRFRGMFEYNKNILDALETLELSTSFKYRMDGRNIWIDNQ